MLRYKGEWMGVVTLKYRGELIRFAFEVLWNAIRGFSLCSISQEYVEK